MAGPAEMPLPAEPWLPSPCVGICVLDNATGWCGGCGRTDQELANWREMPARAQRAVWADLPRRKTILGLGFRLLPWSGPMLLDRLAGMSAAPGAGWSIGVYGAVAEFAANDDRIATSIDGGDLYLRTRGGRAVIRLPPGARAFELVDANGRVGRIALALHRARFKQPPASSITCLGDDSDAIDPPMRQAKLFDLGLARRSIRFGVRTREPALVDLLNAHAGLGLRASPALVTALIEQSPDRVVISPFGRIEVEGPVLRDDHVGPHTHLLPDLLRTGREIEPGLELPPDYVPCASLFPA